MLSLTFTSLPGRAKRLWQDQRARYIVVGLSVLGANLTLALLVFSFDLFLSSALWRNVGNVLVTEAAVIVSFFLHRRFTWPSDEQKLLQRFLKFHAVTGLGLVCRFTAFAALDALGARPMVATVIAIPVAVVVNYFGYDRIVFSKSKSAAHANERSGRSQPR